MEQDEVIRRLKGLGHTATPPAPDFTASVVPVARSGRARLGVGSIAAVVGVLALGTAALAIPEGGPLRQVVASLSTEVEADVETDVAEVEADLDTDDSEVSGSVGATPCDGPPSTGTEADAVVDDMTDQGVTGGATVEVDPEDREAQITAWREWHAANCGPDATAGEDVDGTDDADDSDDKNGHGREEGKGKGEGGNAGTHPNDNDPCKGPPPHSNSSHNGDPKREAEERHAGREAWKQWHHENCPPGQDHDHEGHDEGHGRPDDAGKPDNAGKPDDAGRSGGRGHGDDEDQ